MFATPSSWAESAFRLPLLLCLLTTTGGTADGATVAAAVRFGDGASLPLIIYTKLAYRRRYLSLGESVFGVDFTYNHSVQVGGDQAFNYSIFGVQTFEIGGFLESVDLYLSLRNHHLWQAHLNRDNNAEPSDAVVQRRPLFATMAGFRLQF